MQSLNFQTLVHQAQAALHAMDVKKAERICEILVAQNSKSAVALALMGKVLNYKSKYAEGIKCLLKCVELEPKNIEHHLALARMYIQVGQFKKAVAILEKSNRVEPNDPNIIARLADAFDKGGERQKAFDVLEPYVKRGDETIVMAFFYARMKLSDKDAQTAADVLLKHVNGPLYPPSFFFVLGKALEQLDRIEEAFKAYCTANMQPHSKFDIDVYVREVDDLIASFHANLLARLPRSTHDSSKLVFIVGRPRSGTTLLESILDAHPQVQGVGEIAWITCALPTIAMEIGSTLVYPQCIRDFDQNDVNELSKRYLDYVNKLAPGATTIVDKSLGNFQNLGLIQLLFPGAKIINARRNPFDNCWACFVENMSLNQGYSSDFRDLGIHYRQYERLMNHWKRVLDLPILDVDYEAVVADQEGMSRKVIDFLGLPWDEKCLRFFEKKGDAKHASAAITLSNDQVRKPIYKTSVGRANKFEKFLKPIHDALAEGQAMVDAAHERDMQFATKRDAQSAKA